MNSGIFRATSLTSQGCFVKYLDCIHLPEHVSLVPDTHLGSIITLPRVGMKGMNGIMTHSSIRRRPCLFEVCTNWEESMPQGRTTGVDGRIPYACLEAIHSTLDEFGPLCASLMPTLLEAENGMDLRGFVKPSFCTPPRPIV